MDVFRITILASQQANKQNHLTNTQKTTSISSLRSLSWSSVFSKKPFFKHASEESLKARK